MRLLGVLLWTAFLLLSLLLYAKEEKKRIAEYRGLVRLAVHLSDRLTVAPRPLPEIYADFSDEALARIGFLDALSQTDLATALAAGRLHLSPAALKPFTEFSKELGARLYTQEKQKAQELASRVSRDLQQAEADLPRKRRLAGTLFFTAGMLLLLLLL